MAPKIYSEITYEKLDEIFNFVRRSIYEFKALNLNNEEIEILMPNWFKFLMQHAYVRHVNYLTPQQELLDAKFYDIKVNPHYKNEIVVYCKEFHFNKELDQPKIFEL